MKLGYWVMQARLIALRRGGENLPAAATIAQRVLILFIRAAAECEEGRALGWDDLRMLSGLPDNSIHVALKQLLRHGCLRRFTPRGHYRVNPDGDWPDDGRGKSAGLRRYRAAKRNPTASRPYSVNTLKGLI